MIYWSIIWKLFLSFLYLCRIYNCNEHIIIFLYLYVLIYRILKINVYIYIYYWDNPMITKDDNVERAAGPMAGLSAGAGAWRSWERDPGVEATDDGQASSWEGQEGPGERAGERGWTEASSCGTGLEAAATTAQGGSREQVEVCFIWDRRLTRTD